MLGRGSPFLFPSLGLERAGSSTSPAILILCAAFSFFCLWMVST